MHIIPVIDILNGVVVRGVAGQRSQYQPIQSCFTSAIDPLQVCRAMRQVFGFNRVYVADLDAIVHNRVNLSVYADLARDGFETWIDAGLRDTERAQALVAAGASTLIAGLETVHGPGLIRQLCEVFGSKRIVFSLDLQGGKPLGDTSAWKTANPLDIAQAAIAAGVRRMIVLDLAQVGVGAGVSTLDLCRQLKEQDSELEIITGGGVRNVSDLADLQAQNIDGVLVASALHDGRISAADVRTIERGVSGWS